MTVTTVTAGGIRQVQIETVAPTGQLSTASTVVVTGSEMDARPWQSLAYTVVVATNAIKWSVWAANASDYSDEVAVLSAATVASGATSSYATTQAAYSYYRVKITDDSGGVHGTATIRGVMKS